MTMSENCLTLFDYRNVEELKKMKFFLKYDKNKKEEILLNFEYVLNMPMTPIGKSSEESVEEKKEKQLENINKSIANVKSAVDGLTKKIK